VSWPKLPLQRYQVTTDPLRTERKIELVAAILLLVLCFQLLYSGARLLAKAMPAAVAPAADALLVKDVLAQGGISSAQSAEILQRPLFWEGRRPLEEAAVAVAPKPAQGKAGKLAGVKLLGVFGAGDTAGIIVAEKGKKRRILLGEELSGWTLESVDADQVMFAAGGRTETLQLRQLSIVVPAPPAAAEGSRRAPGKAGQPGAKMVGGGDDELSLGGARR
jgi:type II secretory pathway component PulC